MLPSNLKADQFERYPAEARKLVRNYIGALQKLPLSFVPSLLREVIDYDFKFPAERTAVEKELANLGSLSAEQTQTWFRAFADIELSPKLERLDWINAPAQFVEQLSAHLWTTHQLDRFRQAATEYADRLHAAVPADPPPVPRMGIAIIGQGVTAPDEPLFRKLRPHGAYFSHVKPENGLKILLDSVAARAKAHPAPYGHWYVDGGEEAAHDSAVTCISYGALEPVRNAVLRKMRAEVDKPGMGPEALRTLLAQATPAGLGLRAAKDPILDRFLLVRFAPRQRQKPMNELLSESSDRPELDPVGSLVDADMGAYYNWLNQQRLPSAEQSSFLAWFENHGEAIAIGPSMPRGTESTSVADLRELLSWMT